MANNLIAQKTIETPKVMVGNPNHGYTLTVWAELEINGIRCDVFNELFIDVFELHITKFQDSTTGKEWKGVVGEEIDYEASGSMDCVNWSWYIGGYVPSPNDWNPVPEGGYYSKEGKLTIPYSDLTDASGNVRPNNDWFGDAYGIVDVSCDDGEGNYHHFYSVNDVPAKKLKVFFNPELDLWGMPTMNNPWGNGVSNVNEPCWFIFWKEGEVVQDIDLCTYSPFSHWGVWTAGVGMELGPRAAQSNSGFEELEDLALNPFYIGGLGVHLECIAQVLAHELHHRDIYNFWCPSGLPCPGHNDDDELPDMEENFPGSSGFPGYSFYPNSDDSKNDSFDYGLINSAYFGLTYVDQEVRCRFIETQNPKIIFENKDWSKTNYNPQW